MEKRDKTNLKINRNTNRNNSSALRRRRMPGGFDPLPIDDPRHSSKIKRGNKKRIKRNIRKTKVFIAVSSDVQNRRFNAFQGMIARGLCLPMGNKAKQGSK